uniref:Ig-like domain-containing protein n=1 Tax=Callorhinchus milii TaxID=7868 RepID=A0A4W3IBB4_CALMI
MGSIPHNILLCSSLFNTGFCDGDSVTQKAATMVKKERETVILQCTYFTTENDYVLHWYRHYRGKQREFIIWRYSGSELEEKGVGFGNRFSAQLHKSNSSTSLSISELAVSDSAVYYCAFSLSTVIDCTASLVQKLFHLTNDRSRVPSPGG